MTTNVPGIVKDDEMNLFQSVDPFNPMTTTADNTSQRLQFLQDLVKKPTMTQADYAARLSAARPVSRGPNFYDLMTDISRSMAAAPADAGPFTAMAGGFNTWSDRITKNREEQEKYTQSIALEAAKLSLEDERKADQKLREFAMEAYLTELDDPDVEYIAIQYDEKDADGNFTGKKVQRTFNSVTQRGEIDKVFREQNGVPLDDLPDPTVEGEGDRGAWKSLEKSQAELGDLTRQMRAKQGTILEAKALAAQIPEDQFGAASEALLPFQALLADIAPWALPKETLDSLGPRQAMAALTIQFTLANVAQTKGAISNAEMALFKEAAPYLGQTYEGFLLSLAIQEKITAKAIAYEQAYMDEFQRFLQEKSEGGRRPQGLDVRVHMSQWSSDYEQTDAAKFLNEQEKKAIDRITNQQKELGMLGESGGLDFDNIDNFEERRRRYQEEIKARAARRDQKDKSAQPPLDFSQYPQPIQNLISEVLANPDLSQEEKQKEIQGIIDEVNR